MHRVPVAAVLVLAAMVTGCAASPAAPPASEYVWDPPRPGDTREAHVMPAPATMTPRPQPQLQSAQGAPAAAGEPWVESSDPRWSTRRVAAPQYEEAPLPVVDAPTVYVNPYPYAYAPYYGPTFYGPGYYGGPYYSRPFVGVGIGVHVGGGFRGGGYGGFRGGYGGGFHGGGFRGGGGHGGGRR